MIHHGHAALAKFSHARGNVHQAFFQQNPSRFNFCHIQNFFNQLEQISARNTDLFQCIQDIRLVFEMAFGSFRIADNGVHRRTNIMAHVEQELRLRLFSFCRTHSSGVSATHRSLSRSQMAHEPSSRFFTLYSYSGKFSSTISIGVTGFKRPTRWRG